MIGGPPPAASKRRRTLARRTTELLPLGLAIVAEASWLAVLAGLFHGLARADPLLGLPAMAALVAGGALVGRIGSARLGEAWPLLAVGLVVVGAIGGVLLAGEARAALAADGPAGIGAAVNAHPAGLLAGLAVLRGTAYAAPGLSAERLERVLGGGVVVIVGAAVVGALMAEPWRARFIADTLLAGLVFAAAGIIGLALRRQALEGADRGADWQRNPRWVALLVLVVVTIGGVAAISAGAVRPALEVLIGLSFVPLLVLGLIFGWTRRGVQAAAVFALIGGVVAIAFHLFGGPERQLRDGAGGLELPGAAELGELEPSVVTLATVVATLLALAGAYLLARWWSRRPRGEEDPTERRYIDRPPESAPSRRRSWLPRVAWRRTPHDAVAAYRMLLSELDEREVVRRSPSETPREHAARLRRAEVGGLSLELLAADYALVEFGGATLSAPEQRRALARWRALRRTLQPPPVPPELSDLPDD